MSTPPLPPQTPVPSSGPPVAGAPPVRVRVAGWLLSQLATVAEPSRRQKRLGQSLPIWLASGCAGQVPTGVAAEWAARAGTSASSASLILSGKRKLSGVLLEALEGESSPRARCLAALRGGATLTYAAKTAGITLNRAARIRNAAGIPSLGTRKEVVIKLTVEETRRLDEILASNASESAGNAPTPRPHSRTAPSVKWPA